MINFPKTDLPQSPSTPIHKRISRRFKSAYKKFDTIFALCIFCLAWCLYDSLAPSRGKMLPTSISGCKDGLDWCICPREAVCTESVLQMSFLAVSRGSVYAVYPFIMLLFLSKATHIIAFLRRNLYSVYFDMSDAHHVHRMGGLFVEVATWIHVLLHLIRWGMRGEMSLLTNHITGLTGLIATLVMPLITWPMRFEWFRKKIPFETRKTMHYLSWVWGLCMVFHAPKTHIYWIMGAVMVLYFLDYIVDFHMHTYLVETTVFRKLGTGQMTAGKSGGATLLSFINPEGFQLREASYVMVMLPWISKKEWHAFSVFPHPTQENTSSVCMARSGDWTEKLYNSVERPTNRPAWICGPYLSPFSTALDYDNIICLATGIGITPAFAVLDRLKEHRRINLIWLCRDASLLKFFVEQVDLPPTSFVFIFYTGKAALHLSEHVPANVLVFKDRPKLEKVITYMIHRVETLELLPEEIVEQGNAYRSLSKEDKSQNLINMIAHDYDPYEFFEAAAVEVTDCEAGDVQVLKKSSSEKVKKKSVLRSNLGTNRRASISQPIPAMQEMPNGKTLSRRNLLVKSNSMNVSKRNSTLASERRLHVDFAVTNESFADAVHDFFGGVVIECEVIDHVFDMLDEKGNGHILEADFMDSIGILSEAVMDLTQHDHDEELDNDYIDNRGSMRASNLHGSISQHIRLSEFTTNPRTSKKTERRGSNWATLEADSTRQFVLENPEIIKTWQLLYCGGNKHVVKSLKDISKKFKIDLKIEKFDW